MALIRHNDGNPSIYEEIKFNFYSKKYYIFFYYFYFFFFIFAFFSCFHVPAAAAA